MLTHASLFSGIGGFDLAAEWAGWENIFHCEWNPFGQKVLAHHFPNSKSYHDITKTDFSIHKGTVDVLTGGFPCQPYSSAGKRLGKADERHLFPHMLRAIKEIKPKWVIGENVRGLVSWNDGLVFNEVYDDLESEGYEVQSFLIPAAGVNAPHQRYRIWFVAYSNDKGRSSEFGNVSKENGEISERNENAEFSDSSDRNVTDSDSDGQQQEWRYDRSSQNVNGSNNEEFGSADTKEFNRRNSYGNAKKRFRFSKGVSNKGIYEKDKTSKSNRICEMDQNNIGQEKIINHLEFKPNQNRTLVQDGQSRFQLSNNRGLEFIEKSLSSSEGIRLQDDISRVNRLERNVTDSNCGFKQAWKIGQILEEQDRKEQARRFRNGNIQSDFESFPTQSPICGGDDGLPNRLDNITFSKWRNESVKAYGNAIVPQVAYQIFKAINEFELLVNK